MFFQQRLRPRQRRSRFEKPLSDEEFYRMEKQAKLFRIVLIGVVVLASLLSFLLVSVF